MNFSPHCKPKSRISDRVPGGLQVHETIQPILNQTLGTIPASAEY
jgi:hypothetical protein